MKGVINIIRNLTKVAAKLLILFFTPLILIGCNSSKTEENISKTEQDNTQNIEEYLPISDEVFLNSVQIDENDRLNYTLENQSSSSYLLYGEILEYFDGDKYYKVEEKGIKKDITYILEENKKVEFSIALDKRYSLEKKGKYRILILLQNDDNEINQMVVKDFDYY